MYPPIGSLHRATDPRVPGFLWRGGGRLGGRTLAARRRSWVGWVGSGDGICFFCCLFCFFGCLLFFGSFWHFLSFVPFWFYIAVLFLRMILMMSKSCSNIAYVLYREGFRKSNQRLRQSHNRTKQRCSQSHSTDEIHSGMKSALVGTALADTERLQGLMCWAFGRDWALFNERRGDPIIY